MNYQINEDVKTIRGILDISQSDLAEAIGVQRITIVRIENGDTYPSDETINKIYDFAYSKGIKLNSIKEELYLEENPNKKVLFHGAKEMIKGDISPFVGKEDSDFGHGFYCGESSDQAISFVSRYANPSMYIVTFDDIGLKSIKFEVNQEWMLAIAYFRGTLKEYKNHPVIKKIIKKVQSSDYVIAPIADNRMFRIIDQFIDGLITDVQCKHCLAATNLGNQYVFLNEKATSQLSILEHCYISKKEKEHHQQIKISELNDGDNKVKAAIIKYKNEGKYIGEILK